MKPKILFVAVCIIFLASCKKDSTTSTMQTTEQLLTGKVWKADEIRIQQSNNVSYYYKRGASGNTANYDSDSLKFSTNNTGFYYYSGTQYTTTWNFTNSEKTKMTLVINYSTPATIYLENIDLTENDFNYAQYSSGGGISYLASCSRIPN